MSKEREALKLALEALEAKGDAWIVLERKAKAAIKEALAQPEQKVDWEKLYRLEVKKKEALAAKYERDIKPLTKIVPMAQPEQEPVALYVYKPTLPRGHLGNVSDGDLPWVYDQDPSSGYSARMLVYTAPPQHTLMAQHYKELYEEIKAQRTWVGLTDDEKLHIEIMGGKSDVMLAEMVEAKLKEKNT
jgi:hypothetical protein